MYSSDSNSKEESPTITVFTDGASRGNPGPGGYGAVLILNFEFEISNRNSKMQREETKEPKVIEIGGREDETTNNRMELRAAIAALKELGSISEIQDTSFEIRMYTDSGYVLNGITKWVHGWKKNGWRTKGGDEVKNDDLWQELDTLNRRFAPHWHQLEGHAGIPGNERADTIATSFADNEPIELYHGPLSGCGYDPHQVSRERADTETRDAQTPDTKRPTKKSGKAYSYVSMVDGEIKTHATWPECKQRVTGKDARFRKALSKEHEAEIIQQFQDK